MASITKIFILITAIIAISEETLSLSNDTDQTGAKVSGRDEMLDSEHSMNRVIPYVQRMKKCNWIIWIVGDVRCNSIDTNIANMLLPILGKSDSFNSMTIGIKHRSQRVLRQAPVKTKGSDDGPNWVMPHVTRSSFPLRSTIRNRNRRSSTIQETSSNKNTTARAVRPPVALLPPGSKRPPKLSYRQSLFMKVLASFTSPYLLIVPTPDVDKDYDRSGKIYYS